MLAYRVPLSMSMCLSEVVETPIVVYDLNKYRNTIGLERGVLIDLAALPNRLLGVLLWEAYARQ